MQPSTGRVNALFFSVTATFIPVGAFCSCPFWKLTPMLCTRDRGRGDKNNSVFSPCRTRDDGHAGHAAELLRGGQIGVSFNGSQLRFCCGAGSLLSGQLGLRLPALTTTRTGRMFQPAGTPRALHCQEYKPGPSHYGSSVSSQRSRSSASERQHNSSQRRRNRLAPASGDELSTTRSKLRLSAGLRVAC